MQRNTAILASDAARDYEDGAAMSSGGSYSDRAVLGTAFGLLALGAAAVGNTWLSTGMASLNATGSWTDRSLSPALLGPLVRSAGAELHGGQPVVFWAVFAVLGLVELVGAFVLIGWLADRMRGVHDPSRLARRSDLGDLAGKKAADKAKGLRPSLQGADTLGRDVGIRLMRVAGRDVYMSWEDFALVIMGPRSNKTSALVVPTLLSATGPVIATSNKPDIWSLTKDLRAKKGPVFTFDPMRVAYAEQQLYIDPIAWVRSEPTDRQWEQAARFVAHFMGGVSGEKSDPFFTNAAERVATGAVLAAAATPGGTLRDAVDYLGDRRSDAVDYLTAAGDQGTAAELEKTLHGADVTAEGIYETARTGLKALQSEAVMRWVTPPRTWKHPPRTDQKTIVELDPWDLLATDTSREVPTLYLLSKEGGGSAAPVIAAIVDRIADLAERTAQARGGRLDPSLLMLLDEAANICPLKNLPQYASHWGSRGINALTILQSYKQGQNVWGREQMDALWSASTAKLVGAGVDDVDFHSWLSQLTGEHWVKQPVSVSVDRRGGGGSEQHSLTKEPLFPISRLRSMEKREALLLTPGRPVAHGELLPWYDEDVFDVASAQDISAANDAAATEIQHSAIEVLGRTNPVAQQLRREQGLDQTQHAEPL